MNMNRKKHLVGLIIVVAIIIAIIGANTSLLKGRLILKPIGEPTISVSLPSHYVSKTGNDQNNDGSFNKPWQTIQYAIEQSKAGEIIKINQGNYYEGLTIDKDITLIGDGEDKTFIMKPGDEIIVTINGSKKSKSPSFLQSNNLNVSIENLSLSGRTDQYDDDDLIEQRAAEGIRAVQTNIILKNISLYDIGLVYINLYKSTCFIKNVNLKASILNNYETDSDLGIHLGDSGGTIDGLTNDSNIDHVIDHGGVWVRSENHQRKDTPNLNKSGDLIVRNSHFTGRDFNWGNGIRFFGNGNNKIIIENNIFTGNPEEAEFPPDIQTYLNTPLTGAPDAIYITDGDVRISGNEISGFPTGIDLGAFDTLRVKLINNSIHNNAVGIATSHQGATLAQYNLGNHLQNFPGNNQFYENHLFDIYHRNTATIYAVGNNWHTDNVNQIDTRIHDKLDDPSKGEIIYR